MDIEGTYTLQAAPADVLHCLQDQQTLRRCIPGAERLEVLDEHLWGFTLHIKYAPLTGTYQGQATVLEQESPQHYHMTFQGEGRQNTFNGAWAMDVHARDGNTVVAYKGSIQLGKRAMAPLVKGVLKLLLQQFFTLLTDQLRVTSSMRTTVPDEGMTSPDDISSALRLHPPMSELLTQGPQYAPTETPAQSQQGVLYTLVHQAGLGNGDPIAEEHWVRRVRQFGIISALLALVWLGTRLPKRILD